MLHNERLSLISDVASQLLLNDDPRRILDHVFKRLSTHLGLEAYFNYLVVEDGSRLRLYNYSGISERMAKDIEWLEYGQAICGCVALDKKRIIAEDVQCSTDTRTDLIRSLGITAYCCHPLIAHGRLIGTLSFGTRGRAQFSEDEIALMHTVCDLVATALERAKLISDLQNSQAELEKKVKDRTCEFQVVNRSLQLEIEERRQAEDINSHLAAIIESSEDAILSKTLDGTITSWNDGAEKIFGYKAEEIVGKNKSVLIPASYRGELQTILNKVRMGERIECYETVRMRKDSTLIDVSITVSPVKDKNGRIIGASTIARDITERKRAEEELHKLSIAVEQSPATVVITDIEGNIEYVNPKFTSLTGYTREEALGQNPRILKSGETPRRVYRELWDTILSGREWRGEFHNKKKDGELYWESASISPVKDAGGRITHFIAVKEDITERRQAEEAMMEARQRAELYLDLMGHDINNLNQVALGNLELANEMISVDEEKQLISTALEALNNSTSLIENVRKLQKVKEGGLKTDLIDLKELILGLCSQYQNAGNKNVAIGCEAEDGCYAMVNGLVRDVLVNLIGNAIKHSNGCGQVKINIKLDKIRDHEKKYCRIAVEDNGPGIPDGLKDKLFNRFQRGKTKASGKGLGLYLVRSLVEDFHGRVWVEDRVLGDHMKGSRFVVLLPLAKKA